MVLRLTSGFYPFGRVLLVRSSVISDGSSLKQCSILMHMVTKLHDDKRLSSKKTQ